LLFDARAWERVARERNRNKGFVVL